MSYNSKYSGQQVENLLDQVANGNAGGGGGGITTEIDPIFSASPAAKITDGNIASWNNKVDKVDGKQLSTEDFTTLLKQKLDGLSNYDDTAIQESVTKLRTDLDTLVSGDTTTAIKTFNEVIAFLDGISDTEDLSSIIASIEQQIASKGTVTSITAGEGLAGGTITGSGIISLEEKAQNGKFIDLMSKVDILKIGNTSSDTNITIDNTSYVWMDKMLNFDKFGRLNGIDGYYYYPTKVTFGEATTSLKGLMSASDKAKLDGIDLTGKQDKLVSGTNIKTINGESILGSGNIVISGGGSSSGGGGAYAEVSHGTGDTTFALTPNTFHVWDEVASLDLSFVNETAGVANEYLFQFTSGVTATTLTLPDVKWANDTTPTISENMIYQISILKGLASVLEFSNAVSTITFFVQLGGLGFYMFTCEKGMTWNDFVNSSYNTGEYKLSIESDRVWWNYNCLNNETPSSIIVDGMQYNTTYAD